MCPGMIEGDYGLLSRRQIGTTTWIPVSFVCRPKATPDAAGAAFPGFTIEDVRRLPIVVPTIAAEPSPHTLKNAHTNFHANASAQNFTVDILGFTVNVRAWPVSYVWDYGDGVTSGTLRDPGRSLPTREWGQKTNTSHVFIATGDYNVILTTQFQAEFSVNGGPWQPVPGTAAVNSPPITLSVWRAVTNHYADNCLVNPHGAGC